MRLFYETGHRSVADSSTVRGQQRLGSHFQQSYQNGVAHFRIFWGKTVLHMYGQQTYQNVCTVEMKSKVFFIQDKKWVNSQKQKVTKFRSRKLDICPKVTKLGSIIGHRIDYNGPERPAAHTQQKLTQVPSSPRDLRQFGFLKPLSHSGKGSMTVYQH